MHANKAYDCRQHVLDEHDVVAMHTLYTQEQALMLCIRISAQSLCSDSTSLCVCNLYLSNHSTTVVPYPVGRYPKHALMYCIS
eukprot:19332-Heterococcus_DN1.PRE.4